MGGKIEKIIAQSGFELTTHSGLQQGLNWLLIPASSIHKTSLDLIKTKRKKGFKIFLTD